MVAKLNKSSINVAQCEIRWVIRWRERIRRRWRMW